MNNVCTLCELTQLRGYYLYTSHTKGKYYKSGCKNNNKEVCNSKPISFKSDLLLSYDSRLFMFCKTFRFV